MINIHSIDTDNLVAQLPFSDYFKSVSACTSRYIDTDDIAKPHAQHYIEKHYIKAKDCPIIPICISCTELDHRRKYLQTWLDYQETIAKRFMYASSVLAYLRSQDTKTLYVILYYDNDTWEAQLARTEDAEDDRKKHVWLCLAESLERHAGTMQGKLTILKDIDIELHLPVLHDGHCLKHTSEEKKPLPLLAINPIKKEIVKERVIEKRKHRKPYNNKQPKGEFPSVSAIIKEFLDTHFVFKLDIVSHVVMAQVRDVLAVKGVGLMFHKKQMHGWHPLDDLMPVISIHLKEKVQVNFRATVPVLTNNIAYDLGEENTISLLSVLEEIHRRGKELPEYENAEDALNNVFEAPNDDLQRRNREVLGDWMCGMINNLIAYDLKEAFASESDFPFIDAADMHKYRNYVCKRFTGILTLFFYNIDEARDFSPLELIHPALPKRMGDGREDVKQGNLLEPFKRSRLGLSDRCFRQQGTQFYPARYSYINRVCNRQIDFNNYVFPVLVRSVRRDRLSMLNWDAVYAKYIDKCFVRIKELGGIATKVAKNYIAELRGTMDEDADTQKIVSAGLRYYLLEIKEKGDIRAGHEALMYDFKGRRLEYLIAVIRCSKGAYTMEMPINRVESPDYYRRLHADYRVGIDVPPEAYYMCFLKHKELLRVVGYSSHVAFRKHVSYEEKKGGYPLAVRKTYPDSGCWVKLSVFGLNSLSNYIYSTYQIRVKPRAAITEDRYLAHYRYL